MPRPTQLTDLQQATQAVVQAEQRLVTTGKRVEEAQKGLDSATRMHTDNERILAEWQQTKADAT